MAYSTHTTFKGQGTIFLGSRDKGRPSKWKDNVNAYVDPSKRSKPLSRYRATKDGKGQFKAGRVDPKSAYANSYNNFKSVFAQSKYEASGDDIRKRCVRRRVQIGRLRLPQRQLCAVRSQRPAIIEADARTVGWAGVLPVG